MVPAQTSVVTSGVAAAGGHALTFLVVDDERLNVMVLKALLEADGHQVIAAANGAEAVERFAASQPDMVLMDVMMPVMNGYEATRQIKALAGDRFVPVIFLTAITDEHALAHCVEVGGDDFLTKPYHRLILRSRINAMARIRELHAAVRARNDELAHHHERLRSEHESAEKVLAKMSQRGCLESPGIRYLLSPMSIFNGDLLLAARRPAGGLRLMLGDFAGHGLSAAIGAMPAAEVFYEMTSKGYALSDLVGEINGKLKTILPTGLFMAAALLDVDPETRTLSLWNGGLPDILLQHAREPRRLASRHLPLGVADSRQLNRSVEIVPFPAAGRLLLYTDGLLDACNAAGERFGEARLAQVVQANRAPARLYDDVAAAVGEFRQGVERSDDLTLVEIDGDAIGALVPDEAATGLMASRTAAAWSVAVDLDVKVLRETDPLPAIVQMLTELQGLQAHKERLYIVLGELLTNALDHGLLRMDSRLKRDPSGFVQYYAERAAALALLREGLIRVEAENHPEGAGGRLTIRVIDSGDGFDHRAQLAPLAANLAHSGRGLALVRSLCASLVYRGNGNQAEAVYAWS